MARYSLVLVAFCAINLGLAAKKKPPAAPINLNTATSEELQRTAEKILQMRKSYGASKNVDDLRGVRGIGPKRLEKMRKYLTVCKRGQRPNRQCAEACDSAKAFHSSRGPSESLAAVLRRPAVGNEEQIPRFARNDIT